MLLSLVLGSTGLWDCACNTDLLPHIAKSVSSVTTALLEVDMNYGVMILHNSMQDIAGPETVAIPLEGEPEVPVQMIQRKDSGNPALECFREFIRARVPQGEPEA